MIGMYEISKIKKDIMLETQYLLHNIYMDCIPWGRIDRNNKIIEATHGIRNLQREITWHQDKGHQYTFLKMQVSYNLPIQIW